MRGAGAVAVRSPLLSYSASTRFTARRMRARGSRTRCHLKIGETCDICGAKRELKSTAAMRERCRELATQGGYIDDYDRAVLAVLDDLEALLNR